MSARTQDPTGEGLGTAGLLLNITAVIGFAVGLAGVGVTGVAFTAGAFAIATLTFLISLVCLFLDGRRAESQHQAVPVTTS